MKPSASAQPPPALSALAGRELRRAPVSARELRMVRGKVESRALSAKEKEAGWIGALRGVIPLNTDSVVLRDRALNGGKPFVERIAPKAAGEPEEVMAMAGHTDATLAAFARQGVNLTLTESEGELVYDALVPDTSAGRDLLQLAERGILRGTSFEFDRGAEDKWEKREDGMAVRTVTKLKLSTVNPVIWPAYPDSELTTARDARPGEGSEERGQYLCTDSSGRLDWYDPTVSADLRFAQHALNRATWALSDALEYLRAVAVMAAAGQPAGAGAHADFARAEVTSAAERATTLVAWLAASGAEINPAALQRAQDQLTEARAAVKPISQTDHDRERRARILQLSSA